MAKERVQFVCRECGYESARWLGRCPQCGMWNALVEAPVPQRDSAAAARSGIGGVPKRLSEFAPASDARLSTGIGEFDRVLGGGLVPGSFILVGGDPGIGKSTLVMQGMEGLARQGVRVVYSSGEESPGQTGMRARRLGISGDEFYIVCETSLDAILDHVAALQPGVLVIDSIQTTHRTGVASSPGSIGQVRECGAELMRVAKSDGVAVIVIGHVTKEGLVAGPRTLEHMVDTVLYIEGDRYHQYRLLRAAKNRFGSTNEIGVFEMSGAGLQEVPNPSQMFLSERVRGAPGSVVGCAIEGTRPLLVETQALVSPSCYGVPQRVATGVDRQRLAMLLAVLERRVGMRLGDSDVFVNVAGGLRVTEPALDLSVVLAVASSVKNAACDPDAIVVGEVGLGGEVRGVSQAARRVAEAAKLGFARCIIAAANVKSLDDAENITIRGVRDVIDALDAIDTLSR